MRTPGLLQRSDSVLLTMRWQVEEETYVHLPYWRHQEVAEQGRGGGREGGERKKKQRIITIYNQVSDTSYKIILKTNQNMTLMLLHIHTGVFPQYIMSVV